MDVVKRLQQYINLGKLSRGAINLTAVAMGINRNTVALGKSRNRPAGSEVLKSVVVTKDVYRRILIDKVVLAIKSKWTWPLGVDGGDIVIQQDNARPHIGLDDAEFVTAGEEGGWTIRIQNQPAQSPDLNVLDLGFFNLIQSLQQTLECRSMEELIAAVRCSYLMLSPTKLEKTFLTLRRIILVVIAAKGCNRYKIPRSASPAEDELALSLMNVRLEEKDRLEDVANMLSSLNMDEQ
ncbi:hypothetical protein H310_10629 [Aphanomyces invadans]|uniref:Tc1-like transposase DDE domain-containing protein n=1 Tax=Aphanomyces invadans TaxID=157072 RepID=A0A024TPN5_9STRA|nr:hypothetical protein H310_10629 [Aphanomyces invadans]ETV95973.1 hypothetical protein H310_10629 [Aphanomyces invadans]|eukprot:XP_008875284.1 hypothetical protein H310_10629 [Aphanomyces invadans]